MTFALPLPADAPLALVDPGGSLLALQLRLLPQLGAALLLSAAVGLERQLRAKDAGLRTHALVGLGAALFMLVSGYGFPEFLGDPHTTVDPTRVAAQIVSGIGFLGAGMIVVRSSAVRGLTTAASIWLVAAIGMACGGQLYLLAAAATAGHFVIVALLPVVTRWARDRQIDTHDVAVRYDLGTGVLRDVMAISTRFGWHVTHLSTVEDDNAGTVRVLFRVRGKGAIDEMFEQIRHIRGVRGVSAAAEEDWS